jgi:hypothetical protein
MDRRLISEKQRGFFAKSTKLDRRLILENRGTSLQNGREFQPGFIFQWINP